MTQVVDKDYLANILLLVFYQPDIYDDDRVYLNLINKLQSGLQWIWRELSA